MKLLSIIIAIFINVSAWADHSNFRLHGSYLETFCPLKHNWTSVASHVSDFKSLDNGAAYRIHGKLYFFDRQSGKSHYINKQVSSYEIAASKAVVYVHKRDLYLKPSPGAKRSIRLKGNISSYQFSLSGVLGFIDDGDLFVVSNMTKGSIKRLKGNISSYKIHDNGTFAFVDDGDLFLVTDIDNSRFKRLTKRVYSYSFLDNGNLFYECRKGSFEVIKHEKVKFEHFHEHKHIEEYQNFVKDAVPHR
ncbi:MAG: hypothetical protein HRT88_08125 [Lentisphaeraceae bacterium]|nr:hypothetical protein [Lentisphaeraceae bacterium]